MILLQNLLIWVHVMSQIGAFGGLVIIQYGLPRDVRDTAVGARVGPQIIQWMLAIGLLAGVALVFLRFKLMGGSPGAHFLGVVGVKFLLLLVAGATIGISCRKLREGRIRPAERLRVSAIIALALGALFGVML
ncbi:MAG: hypothetical protein O3B24_08320 [Verrucomicrobia bacterium]|nr:hypothetical protein [Verrucomicrobiota bacterium]